MDSDRIQAQVAGFLAGSATLGAPFDDCDLQRLSLFRGFIVRVKHNNVQKALPLTLRVLAASGLKLPFFVAYAPTYLSTRSAGPLPLDRQVQMLVQHLGAFLHDRADPTSAAAADVLVHEATLWSFRSEPVVLRDARAPRGLSWRGRVAVRRYATDVLGACGALAARRFDPHQHVRAGEHSLLYWRADGSDGVEFFEIDDLTALLVSVAQRRRTVRGVAAQLAAMHAGHFAIPELDDFFDGLAERGFLQPRPAARTASCA